jgi:hypothetical protein
MNGRNFGTKMVAEAAKVERDVATELTVVTQSGVRTRLDQVGRSPTTLKPLPKEFKSSATAPLTPNQRKAFPEIEQTGATVVGKGKPGWPGGTQIPPTKVEVVRPK